MSKIKVNEIEAQTGSTITIPTGQNLVVTDGIATASLPTIPVSKGGTGLTSLGTAGQILKVNSGGTALEYGADEGGKVLQVVSTHKNDDFTTSSSSSFVDVTGLSASITPSSSSNKILIVYSITTCNTNGAHGTHIRLMRDSTEIAPARSVANYTSSLFTHARSDSNLTTQTSFQFLDAPSTTSATTYKIQIKAQDSTATVNRSGSDASSQPYSHKSSSSITVMEIAG